LSRATAAIAARQLAEFEPLDEVPPDSHLALRTDRPLEALLDDLEAALDAQLRSSGPAGPSTEPGGRPVR